MTSVIVLTRDYQFWGEIDLESKGRQRFWKLLSKEKIEILAADEYEEIGTTSFKVKKPFVIRLLKFVGYKIKKEEINWSAEAVFARDNNVCQYWHFNEYNKAFKYRCKDSERTIDHLQPRSKGGENTFENTVCACHNCNVNIKKDRPLKDTGLKLIRKPFVPKQNKGDFAIIKFAYNPNKLSHRIYVERILGGEVIGD